MRKIIITGGAGFIGSNLCCFLISNFPDTYVICIDNMITGSVDNIRELLIPAHPRFKLIIHDINNSLNDILDNEKIDEIYHLASIASPEKYKKYSMETLLTSINGTQCILEYCLKNNSKMLFTSTSEVYGDPLIHPQPEEYNGNVNTVGERSCYDEGKRVAETLIYEYRKKYNLNIKIARLFNTYGPKMDLYDGRVITNFIKQIKNDKPVQIYGDGSQTRSFCYIDDMICGLVSFMSLEENIYSPVNIGNPNCEFTMNDLVSIFKTITSKNISIEYLPKTQDDPMCRKPIIDKAEKLFDFKCSTNLHDGIKQLWNYFLEK
jgi:UDP-glucuronate decarboxylase